MPEIISQIAVDIVAFLFAAVLLLLMASPYVLVICGTIFVIKATIRFLRK
jgi:hypothetical protein